MIGKGPRNRHSLAMDPKLEASGAVEETWQDQPTATRAIMDDFNLDDAAEAARKRVARAVARGELLTNGQQHGRLRIEPGRSPPDA